MKKIKPINKKALILLGESEEQTNGIYLPEKSKEDCNIGRIEDLADDVDPTLGLEIGKYVYVTKHQGKLFVIGGESYVLVDSDKIVATINLPEGAKL